MKYEACELSGERFFWHGKNYVVECKAILTVSNFEGRRSESLPEAAYFQVLGFQPFVVHLFEACSHLLNP
jgi:hypothetical protein